MTKTKIYLKAKLLEKPFVLPCLVSLLKLDLGLPPGLALQSWVPEHILVDNSLVQGDIHRVPCGHEVVVVINFHKGLDLGSLGDLLLAHGSCHFPGIAVNSSHQGMAVRAVRGAIVNVLDEKREKEKSRYCFGPILVKLCLLNTPSTSLDYSFNAKSQQDSNSELASVDSCHKEI